jgi:uncharacterized protein YndB with AHSA1/START domain
LISIELRTFIRAPRERVWDLISDLDSQEHWMEDVSRLEVVYRPGEGPGAVLKLTSRLFGIPLLKDVLVTTRLEPPHLLEIVHCGQFTGSGAFRLEDGDGGTTFIWEEKFQPPLGRVGDIVADKLIGPHLRRVWGRSMDNVRRLAESGATQA